MTRTLFPELLWAQRSNADDEEKNLIYLTINVADIDKPKLSLNTDSLEFEGSNDADTYHVKINFFKEIDVEKSSKHFNGRGYFLVLRKKEKAEEYWPRLTKEKIRVPYIKTDFDKWVDEDEQEEATEDPAAGLGPEGGMGGMGDLGGDFDFSQFSQQLGAGAGGSLADRINPEMLAQLSAEQQGAVEDELAEESLDSIGERINPVEGGEADEAEEESK